MRTVFLWVSFLVLLAVGFIASFFPAIAWSLLAIIPLIALGIYDMLQTRHAVLRNFPVLGHFRYLLEAIRPEIYQYFIESDTEGKPFNRLQRSVVYQRAKKVRDTVPFGTQRDVYAVGYEWINHSIAPIHVEPEALRVTIGGADCRQPYSASLFNISAMSFGSLSKNAVEALNKGAQLGNFAHNTGEGGISSYHLQGGDLIWQIGTGYFGCRQADGTFDPDRYAGQTANPAVKMIELKLSQGAKPGHGGILPAAKLTEEIAAIRGVPMGRDVLSPPGHSSFSTPIGLLEFIAQLRELSGGKPVGFKLCLGKPREFIAICKAMIRTGIKPDFIAVDGGEGGTGAAPLEFSNHIGSPLIDGLMLVDNALRGFSLRDDITVFASGKITTGFQMLKRLALGADVCYSARGMMMALGCIQALKCNSNHCPVGVATQKSHLVGGLVPSDKSVRVANFHYEMVESLAEMMGAMAISSASALQPWHILRRTAPNQIQNYAEIYPRLEDGQLLNGGKAPYLWRAVEAASAESFGTVE